MKWKSLMEKMIINHKIFLLAVIFLTSWILFTLTSCNKNLIDNPSKGQIIAKGYLYNLGDSCSPEEIVYNGQLNPSIVKSISLSQDQIAAIENIINADTKYIEGLKPAIPALCFYPRHGIVFFYPNGKIKSSISICFECYRLKTLPEKEIENIYAVQLLRKIIEETELPVFNHYVKYQNILEGSIKQ
jgi:hypothetical protein